MRISSTQYAATVTSALQDDSAQIDSLLAKISSGQQYTLPSENPVASIRLLRLSREQATLDQYRTNIGALKDRLSKSEAFLNGISNDLLSSRDLLVWALNGSNSSNDLSAMAGSLQPIMDSIFYTANSRDSEGHYVFSGTLTSTQTITYDPTAAVGSRYTFTGNTATQQVAVGDGITQPANVTLSDLAGLLNQLDSAHATLVTPGVDVNVPATHTLLATALDNLDAEISSISAKTATLGGTQNLLSTLDTNHQNVGLANQRAALSLGQLDYADAETKLTGYNSALQATQKAYAAVSKLSLFDIL